MTGKEAGHTDQHPPHIQNPDALEVAPGTEHEQLEGWSPTVAGEEDLRQALEKAFDYRGDITITRKDGKNSNEKVSIPYSDVAALAFTGRDTAAGKSWEAWMKKYAEKKARGETDLSLYSEPLE